MPKKYLVPLLAVLALGVLLPGAASSKTAALPMGPPLVITFGGPTKVVPDTNVTYSVTLKNSGKTVLKRVKLMLQPAEIITASSKPYSRYIGFYKPHLTAAWLVKTFKPGASYKVKLTLSFPSGNATVYSFLGEAQVLGLTAKAHKYLTVHYVSSP